MTKVRPKEEAEAKPEPEHRNGSCSCTKKQRHVVRRYMGYGLCGHCGKLTSFKMKKGGA